MTALLLAAVLPAADPIETARGLDLRVTVVEAVEDGPIILDVSLTNRGPQPLAVGRYEGKDCEIVPPAAWLSDRFQLGCGYRMPVGAELKPGETWTERHAIHAEWLGRFPAGPAPVTVSWPLDSARQFDGSGSRRIATPTRTVVVTVAPATPATLAAVARRVEADLAALPRARPAGADSREWADRVDRAAARVWSTRHPELVPVALKFLDWCPVGPDWVTDDTRHVRRSLVWTVFGADPATAHRLFVDRLTAKSPPADPAAEFEVWADARENVFRITRREFWRETFWGSDRTAPAAAYANAVLAELAGFLTAARRLLPAGELTRLAAADDFWVRALTFATFADRLDPAWQDAFLRDVRGRSGIPLDRRAELVLESLYHQPGAGRLLDALAAGPDADPAAKAARKRRDESK
jgi:hypothetical protein